MSDYRLDDWAIEVQSPAEAENFSSNLCVQTGSGPTQLPNEWVSGIFSLAVKHSQGIMLITHPQSIAKVKNE
jgi:hypothetical protein